MSELRLRADAHAHLFKPGWAEALPESCRLVQPDEPTVYAGLAAKHRVKYLLAVGYEGEARFAGNNDFLASVAAQHPWVRPVAYFASPSDLSVTELEKWASKRFVGVSLYLFAGELIDSLGRVADDVWQWFARRKMLISVNAQGLHWRAWHAVLERHPQLRLVVSHLGLPAAVDVPLELDMAREGVSDVISLSSYQQVHVKLSGFYALSKPGHDYPHETAWPYVHALLEAFGADRLLWGSDFFPAADFLSFPQTYALFEKMCFLSESDRAKIEGANLIRLIDSVE